VIDRTADHFGVTFTSAPGVPLSEVITGVVFYLPQDESALERPQPWPDSIRLVDGVGKPSWAVPWHVVRYDELMAASDAGLIEGDPLRPYFWPVIPQGDAVGVLLDPTLLWLLQRNYAFILEHAAGGAIGTAAGLVVKEAWERLKRSHDVRHPEPNEFGGAPELPRWSERLARPDDFLPILVKREPTTEEAADILGCPLPEAEAVMWGLGFALDPSDGRWRNGGDEAAALIATDLESAQRTGALPPDLAKEALREERGRMPQ
jgi:hypothetical protein